MAEAARGIKMIQASGASKPVTRIQIASVNGPFDKKVIGVMIATVDGAINKNVRLGGLIGDVNDDGVVDISDYTACRLYVLGLKQLTASQLDLSDVNRDGVVTDADSALIQKMITA